uniref:Large ribosomal subunit protein uL22c n=1 Tax=Crouania attenuata TaxID=42002 RepID=A0A4D6WPT7_9FLOR|nr:ribosomal protein L22 [Crouania attenuata]
MNSYQTKARAQGKYLRLSTHKVRRVADQIRGKNYKEALLMLKFMPYKSCIAITKVLKSATSNLQQQNNNIPSQEISIIQIFVNKGPTMKRFQPRAQGRAFPIHKPTCHINIQVGINTNNN